MWSFSEAVSYTHLACFGYVTDGMEVVDAICKDTQVEDNNGTVAKDNQPVIDSIKVID